MSDSDKTGSGAGKDPGSGASKDDRSSDYPTDEATFDTGEWARVFAESPPYRQVAPEEGTPDRRTPDRRTPAPAFLVGGLAGMLVLGLVWVTASILDDRAKDSPSVVDTTAHDEAQEAAEEESGTEGRRAQLDRCREAAGRLSAPLRAAQPAMDQWEIHVDAMNQLVAGDITLQQATDFWERTRLGARRQLSRFDDAVQAVRGHGLGCPDPADLGHSSTALRSCAERVAADDQTLTAAEIALHTWAVHVEDMDMMRMGHLSPAEATQRWLVSWRQGVREIEDYRNSARAAHLAGGC